MSGNRAKTPEINNVISSSGSNGENSNAVVTGTEEPSSISETFEISNTDGVHRYNFGALTIKPMVKKFDGDVWKHFGQIYKDNKLIPMLCKKLACKACFDKRKWKWSVINA